MSYPVVQTDNLPDCCRGCGHLTSLEGRWGEHVGWGCSKRFIPTRKRACRFSTNKEKGGGFEKIQ